MIRLELTEQQVAVIGAALGNYAYRDAAPVIQAMQTQIDAQQPAVPPMNGGKPAQKPNPSVFKAP